jgi:tRNA threonylcarbamoyl adenosine modification protein (Sua5/YciO/YrdC/YwlC family)
VKAGGIIAFPTDTVYGIGVSAFQTTAIEKIYQVKGRSTLKAIPILLGDSDTSRQITPPLLPSVQKLVNEFWPGPLTLVLPLLTSLPDNLSPTPTIGLRVPDHEFTRSLLEATGPLATTSANLSGEPSALTADEVQSQLGTSVDLILDGGKSPGGMASTVLDCTTDQLSILREGPLSWNDIQSILGNANS